MISTFKMKLSTEPREFNRVQILWRPCCETCEHNAVQTCWLDASPPSDLTGIPFKKSQPCIVAEVSRNLVVGNSPHGSFNTFDPVQDWLLRESEKNLPCVGNIRIAFGQSQFDLQAQSDPSEQTTQDIRRQQILWPLCSFDEGKNHNVQGPFIGVSLG